MRAKRLGISECLGIFWRDGGRFQVCGKFEEMTILWSVALLLGPHSNVLLK